jgi:hypothetical protein
MHTAQEWFNLFQIYRRKGYWTNKAQDYVGHGFFKIDELILHHPKMKKYDDLCQRYGNDVERIRGFLAHLHEQVRREQALMRPPYPQHHWGR